MSVRLEVRLWAAQRATAFVLAACVAVHLATIIHAVRGGFTAGEILARTHGNLAWAAFYAVFVVAAAVHAAVGLRNILAEWLHWRGAAAGFAVLAFGVLLVAAGLRAVWAVFA